MGGFLSKEEILHFLELKKGTIPYEYLMPCLILLEKKEDKFEFIEHCFKKTTSKALYTIFAFFCDDISEIRWLKNKILDRNYKKRGFLIIFIE